MLVVCTSGKVLDVPAHHNVFAPVGDYMEGDLIDPSSVEVEPALALVALKPGYRFIVDNRVEVVLAVTAPHTAATLLKVVLKSGDQICGIVLR